jgi:Raf kinase inhibitor-like YbhB/YbcL family protein
VKSHVLLLASVLAALLLLAGTGEDPPATPMKISTTSFSERRPIPERFTADGKNINPPLVMSGVPREAKSLVLIVDDPDAPMGVWNHWLVWNISPGTTVINEDSVPRGATLGSNDAGTNKYVEPSPPRGTPASDQRVRGTECRGYTTCCPGRKKIRTSNAAPISSTDRSRQSQREKSF